MYVSCMPASVYIYKDKLNTGHCLVNLFQFKLDRKRVRPIFGIQSGQIPTCLLTHFPNFLTCTHWPYKCDSFKNVQGWGWRDRSNATSGAPGHVYSGPGLPHTPAANLLGAWKDCPQKASEKVEKVQTYFSWETIISSK